MMTQATTQGANGAEPKIDHEFKSHPDVFWPAARGEKAFEYRRDDRGGYYVGQTVRLRCFDPAVGYVDVPPLDRRITNILRGGEFELPPGYCILGLAPLSASPRTDGAGAAAGPIREALEEIQEAADDMLTSLPDHWHDDATIRLTDAAADARNVLQAAAQDDLYDVSPAPAAGQAGAVPDSLRVRLESLGRQVADALAAIQQVPLDDAVTREMRRRQMEALSIERCRIAAQWVDTLIASHPAGQSTGPGTGERAAEIVNRWHQWMLDVSADMDQPEWPTASRQTMKDDRDYLLSLLPGITPAPSSPRMAQEGTGWALVPAEPTQAMWTAFRNADAGSIAFTKAYRAMLAARPAAPEAQGAWSSVPEEATEAMWQAGREADTCPGDSYSAVWRAMVSAAPPASSGQGGR